VPERLQRFARVIALLGLVWFLAVGAVQKLLPLNPRYFMITCAAACVLTGAGLALLFQRAKTRLPILLTAALLISTNLLGIYVENKDSLFGAEQLAKLTAERPKDTIYTDPMTRFRADMLLRWQKAQPRAVPAPPAEGALYLYNPKWADSPNFMMKEEQIEEFKVQPDWEKLGSWEPEPPLITKAIEASGLSGLIPGGIWQKLRYRHPPVTLYRARQTKG
jgi:hypothetical protein